MNKILLKILDILHRILHTCIHYTCAVVYGLFGKKVPPVKNPILLLSATELAKRIREGKLRSVSVVQAYIDRIYEVDPYINATVDRRFEDALEEAKEADSLVASGKMTKEQLKNEKPLLGVPFTVKILITVKGFRCTGGSLLFKDRRAQEDGIPVSLLKKAGAILLASTNSPECGLNFQSANKIHGATLNPYNTSRTSGASSGGEGALIGAAGSLIGLGNDLAGSLRIPGCFTGIFGHKPSRGFVSNDGCFPVPDPELQWLLSTGPLCRYAEDLITTMKIISAPDEISNKFGHQVCYEKLKVYYLFSFGENLPFIMNVDPEIKDAIRRAVSHFQTKGSITEEVSIPALKHSFYIFYHALLSSVPDPIKTITVSTTAFDPIQECIKYLCCRSMFTLGFVFASLGKRSFLYKEDWVDFYKEMESELDHQLSSLLDENSILILPTMPFAAPYHNEIVIHLASISYAAIFNVFGLPVTQCPAGLNKQGLPLGLSIIGQKGNDPLTISCALEFENVFGGWKAP